MARVNIKNIENVEGKYHLMFFEGKNMVENAKNDLRYAWFSLLLFAALILLFIVLSGFNIYYIGFAGVFLIIFVSFYVYFKRQKRKGVKQCVYAVQNSNSTDIVAKQVDTRRVGKAFVKSMSSNVDQYDVKENYPHFLQKYKRKRRQKHLVDVVTQFERDEKKGQ